jgi:hypothetical protein
LIFEGFFYFLLKYLSGNVEFVRAGSIVAASTRILPYFGPASGAFPIGIENEEVWPTSRQPTRPDERSI